MIKVCNKTGGLTMNEHDVIRQMGRFPNTINTVKRMTSKVWKCSICGKVYNFETKQTTPSPCKECDGKFFETVK